MIFYVKKKKKRKKTTLAQDFYDFFSLVFKALLVSQLYTVFTSRALLLLQDNTVAPKKYNFLAWQNRCVEICCI